MSLGNRTHRPSSVAEMRIDAVQCIQYVAVVVFGATQPATCEFAIHDSPLLFAEDLRRRERQVKVLIRYGTLTYNNICFLQRLEYLDIIL